MVTPVYILNSEEKVNFINKHEPLILYDDLNHSDLIFYYVNSNEPISLDHYVPEKRNRFLSNAAVIRQFESGISAPVVIHITSWQPY